MAAAVELGILARTLWHCDPVALSFIFDIHTPETSLKVASTVLAAAVTAFMWEILARALKHSQPVAVNLQILNMMWTILLR